jgi:hypothetical protein
MVGYIALDCRFEGINTVEANQRRFYFIQSKNKKGRFFISLINLSAKLASNLLIRSTKIHAEESVFDGLCP